MAFNKNLQNYEMVEDRLKRFWTKCPDGRIDTEVVNVLMDGAMIMVKAYLYAHRDDKHPVATGLAMDWKGKDSGATKTNWMETSETSAIGRAIANSPYQSKKAPRPSREEMQVALGRKENQEKNTPTKVVIEETEKEKQQPKVDEFYKEVEEKSVSEQDLKEIEELNKQTIDGWLDNVKAEYHKKMVGLNPNIDKDDRRMHIQKAFIEKTTLEKGRKKFQDGVDYWEKNFRSKPYDIEDREKGDVNLSEINVIKPGDLPSVMEDLGIDGDVKDFAKFPNMIKEENAKIKNTDLAATEKQINLIYTCSSKRNISESELKDWLNFHFGTTDIKNITRLEASWVLDGFFKNR